ncbi:ABC transporter substrate-binding protein [Marasmitruncus massiliensis]|uniref:ABC transporter substrate-binding protein n=1 Tax=Marasmitruncus massiliensis TaxID=1944642 RepID=UPI000C7BD16B|nr:sugar ABC transporter substrate-binding protein [Marasmitruncus massiliensis]
MKKLISTALALVLCAGTLAACGGKDAGGSSAPASSATPASSAASSEATANEPVTITHWYWADNSEYSAVMQEMVKDFNATNGKNITVVAEEYPWDGGKYSENLFTAVMGGGGPDTASWKLTATPLFTANNLLANLDDYVANWADKDLIEPSLYDVMKQASGTDSIYVMPWNTQVLYVYYRPSMFKEAGVEVPKTYDDFLTACEKLTRDTNGDGKTDVYGFGMRGSKGGQEPWGSFVQARGGNFEDFTTPEAIQGMQDFIDLYTKGYVPPTATADGFNEIIANFKSGKTAMTVHHTGSSAEMVDTFGDDVAAFPFPAGKGQWTSMGDTENVMFESCENKDAAFEWMSYLATGKGQETWCVATGNVPVSKEVQQLPQFQEDRFMKASIEGAPYAGIFPILDTTTEWISNVWPNTVAAALTGQMTAEQAMQELQKALYA